jgi:hypothetical protein
VTFWWDTFAEKDYVWFEDAAALGASRDCESGVVHLSQLHVAIRPELTATQVPRGIQLLQSLLE